MATWSNWTGLATAHPTQELSPHDADEVVEAVVAARRQNLTVKMTGTGHSFTDIAVTDGLLLRPDSLHGIVGVRGGAEHPVAVAEQRRPVGVERVGGRASSALPAGVEHLQHAVVDASDRRPDLAAAIAALAPVLADPSLEVARRFQQTTGPVMAKGVEDTAFYRYTRLGSLTEVGGDPSVFAVSVAEFHRAQASREASWPHAMTTLSTHDTKRGEDVRARLDVLSEVPRRWAAVRTWRRSARRSSRSRESP